MDKLTVFNRALSLISAAPYQQNTGVQHPCDLWYSHALLKANERADWSFARRRVTLYPDANSPSGYSVFSLPADCLKVQEVFISGTRTKTNYREILGRSFETEPMQSVDLVYTANVVATMQELPDNEPTFCEAVICLLAALISPEINGQNSNGYETFSQYFEKHVQDAIYSDQKQTRSNDQSPLPSIYARRTW